MHVLYMHVFFHYCRSVGERDDRPLSRIRPATATCDEPANQHAKEAKTKLRRCFILMPNVLLSALLFIFS